MEDIKVRNIYMINGISDKSGIFSYDENCETYIAEVKIGNEKGYKYYSFITRYKNDSTLNLELIRIYNLDIFLQNPLINVEKVYNEKLKNDFLTFYKSNQKERTNIKI